MAHASWLYPLVNPEDLQAISKKIAHKIKIDSKHFAINAIVVTGVSGNVIGGVVSYLTGIPLIIVRKDEKRHSGYDLEYSNLLEFKELNYVFVDDLIYSGDTLRRVQEKINDKFNRNNLMKIYLYNQDEENVKYQMEANLHESYPFFQIDKDYGR